MNVWHGRNTGECRTCSVTPVCGRAILRAVLCVTLSVSLAFIPLDIEVRNSDLSVLDGVDIQRNEAQAFVPIGVGGAAAVGAALGLTEAELAAGIAALCAAGAGVYLYAQNPIDTNGSITNWPTDQAWPGFQPWDDLTPQEKQDWVGTDGTVDDYWQQQLDIYSLNLGLWEYGNGGNPEPTPEPDDPDDKEKWFTKNNVITALATGGAVALGTVASTLVDNAAGSLADLLFGKSENSNLGLSIDYVKTVNTAGRNYKFGYFQGATYVYGNTTYQYAPGDWYVDKPLVNSGIAHQYYYQVLNDGNNYNSIPIDSINVTIGNDSYSRLGYTRSNGAIGIPFVVYDNGTMGNGSGYATTIILANERLNAVYSGTYVFMDSGGNEVSRVANGIPSGTYTETVDYNQLPGTPSQILNNVFNDQSYLNNVNNYSDTGNDTKKAVQFPTTFSGSNNTPVYGDYVKTTPIEDITPIPDDAPIPTPGPGPSPEDPTQFQEDFGEEVARLLAQPFDQLFPFCLIGDLKIFTEKVSEAFTQGSSGRRAPTNYDRLVIPLEDFNIDGLDNFEFDLLPMKDIGGLVKPWINALLVVALLVGSFRFFLNRGGE